MRWLLDTCVISELVTGKPDERVVEWIDTVESEQVYLTVITVGEIRKGIEKLPDSKKKRRLHTWLAEDLFLRFQGRIVPIDVDIILACGALTGKLEKEGKKMGAIDALIAATALSREFVLVTRNSKDFVNTGVGIFNPWERETGH
jgi:predicted nucleic acid-binding protein